ncbi:DUF6056 family protein [Intestinibacter bartlettii]|uniref:Glycosyltransferase RgtA/B/C/D-like domain-containing protein n=1 Tax=Intestinibacter bartlettii TaxID=261299 RepID=A0ABS6E1I5_9FIRM|nr:DUF6056 family protein [Intestinibacter bartlettii]MBU5337322.1 hypothetical protein [Intestinibacter bartlettii]
MKINKIKIQKILIFFMLNLISLKFILIADDYIFANLNLNNMWEFIFNNQGTETWCIKNGRYLGNTIGILLSMTYKLNYLNLIKGIFMGSGIFILILLCSKLSDLDTDKSFIISTVLILLAPISIYREVYSWTSAYVNYLVPSVLFLIILLILDNCINKKAKINYQDIIFIGLLGISCQLFMENITIYIFSFSLILIIISFFKYKNILKLTMALWINSLIGMVIMFSCKGYRQINTDGYRNINIGNITNIINSIIGNGLTMIDFIIMDNFILISLILIVCLFIIKYNTNKNKFFIISIFVSIIYMLFINFVFEIMGIDINQFPRILRIIKYFLNCIFSINIISTLIYTIFKFIEEKTLKKKLYFYCISIVTVSMPLIIIYPIATRCFFICYVFLTIICMKLISYAIKYEIININGLRIIPIILVTIILTNKYYIFNNIKQQFDEIISYTEEQIADEHIDNVLLPEFKYQKYFHSDIAIFIGFLYYHNTPNDIKFKTIDRYKWEEIANNK